MNNPPSHLYHEEFDVQNISALLSPLPSPENLCSSLGLLFNGIPGCIRTSLIGGQIPLTFIRGCGDLNKSLALYVCYGGSFFVSPQMTQKIVRPWCTRVSRLNLIRTFFVTLNWSHTINRLSRLPSLTLLFTGFRAVPVPVTEDKPLPKI